MSRILTWAIGTIVLTAVASSWSGGRVSRLADTSAPRAASQAGAGPAPSAYNEDRVLTVSADFRGHFLVHPTVEGSRVRMLVDTGASLVALTYQDATKAGIRPDRNRMKRISTANGVLEVQAARIAEMRLGDILVRDVEAVIMPPGRLDTSLLGMSFLRGLRGFEVGQGRILLKG